MYCGITVLKGRCRTRASRQENEVVCAYVHVCIYRAIYTCTRVASRVDNFA